MACEFLLLNGSNIDSVDRNGETALHLATEKGFTQLAYLLLKHKANYNIDNKMGKKAIDIAVDQVRPPSTSSKFPTNTIGFIHRQMLIS